MSNGIKGGFMAAKKTAKETKDTEVKEVKTTRTIKKKNDDAYVNTPMGPPPRMKTVRMASMK